MSYVILRRVYVWHLFQFRPPLELDIKPLSLIRVGPDGHILCQTLPPFILQVNEPGPFLNRPRRLKLHAAGFEDVIGGRVAFKVPLR